MNKSKRVIPGFRFTFGLTITYLSLIVLIPLSVLLLNASGIKFKDFIDIITNSRVAASFGVSIKCSFIAALINALFGTILAWVLVRYDFPLNRILDGLIDLPFALPTAVAGISLTTLYSQNGFIGRYLYSIGIKSAFSQIGITIALVFIGIPFVVRNIQPVLQEFDYSYEEAAIMLGAGKARTFLKVILPEIFSPLIAGFGLAFARGIGEYGSVVFISGNMPMKTEIVPILIKSKLEQYDYVGATAIGLTMLIVSFAILVAANLIEHYTNKTAKG